MTDPDHVSERSTDASTLDHLSKTAEPTVPTHSPVPADARKASLGISPLALLGVGTAAGSGLKDTLDALFGNSPQ